MDKTAIKTFAINSRRKLMEDVEFCMNRIGITKDGIFDPVSVADGVQLFNNAGSEYPIYDEDIKKRESLIKEVNNKGFENVVEEVAYTWFNRIIAIRYMEVNDYLPTKIRVFSSETPGKLEPDIITEVSNIDLDFTNEDRQHIFKLKDENKTEDLFRFLFIKQCNKLNNILPGLFEKTEDYMELLLNISFVSEEGVIRNLVDKIPEQDFTNQIEIIGWLYQFYNVELKDEIFKGLKKNVKINKEHIPAATQLFTPDWIVKYMVENSLGKLWIQNHPNDNLKSNWIYYIEDSVQEDSVESELSEVKESTNIRNIENLKVIDPCCGSGHILVYIFDILMQIYVSEGYTEKDAAISILENNLYGLEIDDRAYQLSYFAVMMKARSYNRKIFTKNISPMILSIQESNNLDESVINLFSSDNEITDDLKYLFDTFFNAKNFGSILNIKQINFKRLFEVIDNAMNDSSNLKFLKYQNDLIIVKSLIKQAEYLYNKYDVVVTNPPYMGASGMNQDLKDYLKKYYPLSKSDLFAVFLEKGLDMVKDGCFNSMVTMQSWMFLSSFEKLRKQLLDKSYISNLLHMENMVMGIAFGTSATVFRKTKLPIFKGAFNHIKLNDIGENNIPLEFPVKANRNMFTSSENFNIVPGSPIAYWIDDNIIELFLNCNQIKDISILKSGRSTSGLNDKLFKFWFEVDFNEITLDCSNKNQLNTQYVPLNKGGPFRKWFGNKEYVSRKEFISDDLDFKESITWSDINASYFSARYHEKGIISNNVGKRAYFDNEDELFYVLGYLNTNLCENILDMIIPTVHFDIGYVGKLPIIFKNEEKVIDLVKSNITLAKNDWDDYEISWNFTRHPFLSFSGNNLEEIFDNWKNFKESSFRTLKYNEIELNKIFNESHNVGNVISVEIEDNNISITRANYIDDIKTFISYAIGCMFGRYSLDNDSLQFAGGKFSINEYSKFIPDEDNIIPVLDTEYFNDDIVGRFVDFIKICFGEETLEENLQFIASALKKKGKTSRDIIRNYFLTDFFKDHSKNYKKCPIYWQFNSGKQNGFNCLVYMHRYDPSLVARVRTDYLHKTQKKIEERIEHYDNIINNSNIASQKSNATKEKNKLIKQLAETREYDEALAFIASQNIEIDLDDGVKVNYAKFQNVPVKSDGQKTKKINLLKKI